LGISIEGPLSTERSTTMSSPSRKMVSYLLLLALSFGATAYGQRSAPDNLKWLTPDDNRLRWLNVADWEAKTGGLQPVRMPKAWRDKIPERSADRALSTAGVAVRFRTDSSHIAIRVT